MASPSSISKTFLVLGATGGTGKHFVHRALSDGHTIRALVRSPGKLPSDRPTTFEVVQGSITDASVDTDKLVLGVDHVIVMLGDKEAQRDNKINLAFMKRLVPSMRKQGVKRILYQAGAMSRPAGGQLSPLLWILRNTIARGFAGQHADNDAVLEYLATEAADLEWIGHRAGIIGDGPSKGVLKRSETSYSIGVHVDCAEYSYRLIFEDAAVHTSHFSVYE